MFNIIGTPFGYVLHWLYVLVNDYGVALLLFTLFTKLILLPIAVKQQKSMAKTQLIQPKLAKLQKMYAKNKTKLNEEQMKLYSEEGVNPMSSCLPMLIQLPIIYGLLNVVYKPIHYILQFSNGTISKATDIMIKNKDAIAAVSGVAKKTLESRPETYLIKAVNESPQLFESISNGNFVEKIHNFKYSFLGLSLGDVPSFTTILILIPIINLLVNVGYSIYMQWQQKKRTGDAKQPGGLGMNLLMIVGMPLFSTWFAFQVPAALGIYWIFSTVFMFIQSIFLYRIYSPEKMETILAAEKAKKKKSKKKSFYERALEAQQLQNGMSTAKKPSSEPDVTDENGKKLSKSELKDYERKVLNEARKRMAEKYGDDYDDTQDE